MASVFNFWEAAQRLGAVQVLLLQNNPLLLAQKGIRPIPAVVLPGTRYVAVQGFEGMDSKEILGKILQENNKSTLVLKMPFVKQRGATRLILMAKHSCSISQLAIYKKKKITCKHQAEIRLILDGL